MSSNHSLGHRRAAGAAGILTISLGCLLLWPSSPTGPLEGVVDLQSVWATCVGLVPVVVSGFLTGAVAAILTVGISHRHDRQDFRRRTAAVTVAEAAQ